MMMNMHEMLMIMIWDVNACLTPRGVTVVPVVEVSAPPQGSTLALIDLSLDDSTTDKRKQATDVEVAEAFDGAGTSAALGGD
jgi:hypothetical protein